MQNKKGRWKACDGDYDEVTASAATASTASKKDGAAPSSEITQMRQGKPRKER